MDTKQIKKALRYKFTDCAVSVEPCEYTYLHQDSESFETRTLPAIKVRVTGNTVIGYTYRGKPMTNQPDTVSIVDFLRSIGLCAEYCYAGRWQAYIIDAQKDQYPINISTGLGSWNKA